jgi:hypothetical protein
MVVENIGAVEPFGAKSGRTLLDAWIFQHRATALAGALGHAGRGRRRPELRRGVHMNAFTSNEIVLPAIPSTSRVNGLSFHMGRHPGDNSRIFGESHAIRANCESV